EFRESPPDQIETAPRVTPESTTESTGESEYNSHAQAESSAPPIHVTLDHVDIVEEPRVIGRSYVREASEAPVKGIEVVHGEKGLAAVDDGAVVPSGILKRLGAADVDERVAAVAELATMGGDESFRLVTKAFDDPSAEVRNAAARSLHDLQSDRAASF